MTYSSDPVEHWSRQLAVLRTQAVKHRRRGAPCGDLSEEALATCEALLVDLARAHREGERLRTELLASTDAWEHLFDVMPGACLLTNSAGWILNANRTAGRLLSLAAPRLKDRQLLVFAEDRDAFRALLHRLANGEADELRETLRFRPRERRPALMDIVIVPMAPQSSRLWLWFLTPATGRQQATDTRIVPANSLSLPTGTARARVADAIPAADAL